MAQCRSIYRRSLTEVLGKYSSFFKGHNEKQLFSASGYQSVWIALGILILRICLSEDVKQICLSEDVTVERLEAWAVNTAEELDYLTLAWPA